MRRLSLSLIGAAIAYSAAAAQDPAAVQAAERASAAESAAEQPTAPVIVDGATLFRVRGVSAYPAERRAAEIADRISALASDRTVPVESLTVNETPVASLIVARGRRVLGVLDADAELEGLTRQVLAQAYRARVAEAIQAYRHDREAAVLWPNVGKAAMATIAFVLGIALGLRALRWLRRIVERRYHARIQDVRLRSIEIMRAEQLWRGLERAMGLVATLIALLAGYVYLNYVLILFPWTRALGYSLFGALVGPLATLGTGLVAIIPNIIFLTILALITRYAVRLVRVFFQHIGDGTIKFHGFEPEWAQPTGRIARFAVIAFALVIAYPYIPGSGSEAFKGLGLLIGLMFSLGSPSVIGNVVAGLSLAFRRAFRIGDRVKIGEHIGEVTHVRMLATYLRSPKNEQIVIPNSVILTSDVVNYSTLAPEQGLILHTNVGIGYETPWRQVEAMLLESARRTPGLRSEPEPFVLQRKLGDFAVDYELNAYCDTTRGIMALYSELHRNILDVFNEYGVQIMTPAYEGDPEQAKVVPRSQWFTSPAKAPSVERVVGDSVPRLPADVALTTRIDSEGYPSRTT